MQVSFYQAISHITLSLAVSIEFLVPLIVGCLRSRSPRTKLPAVGAMLGLGLIADYSGGSSLAGALWALLTGVLLSIYIKLGTDMPPGTHPLVMLSKALWIALPVVVAAQLMSPTSVPPTMVPFTSGAIAVAVLTMIIPFSLELFAMARLRPLPFAMISALDPALASAVGAVALHQLLNLRQFTGLIILTGCAVLAIWADTKRAPDNHVKS